MSNIYNMADTWNNAGAVWTSIKMNVTDTGHAAGSLLMDLQVGAASKFNVDPSGNVTAVGAFNNVTVTPPATGSTLTILDGKTLTVDNILELAGTDGTKMTFPATSATIARTDAANTFTGNQTISSGSLTTSGNISAPTWGGAAISNITGVRIKGVPAAMTDTTAATGTTAVSATNILGGNTIAATNTGVIFTNYYEEYIKAPVAGANVSLTNAFAFGADKIRAGVIGTAASPEYALAQGANYGFYSSSSAINVSINGIRTFALFSDGSLDLLANTAQLALGTNGDTVVTRVAAQNFRLGSTPSASPLTYTMTIGESSISGTSSNVGGANGTIQPGLGTGSGALAKLLLQGVVTQGGGATLAQTYATAISINNTTATGLQFNGYGAGAITSDGSGNLTASSDPRMKNIQRSFTPGLEAIKAINPIVYKWKPSSGMDSENEYAGFDAQNVRDAIEMATWKGSDGTLSLQDRALLAVCVNAIKELAGVGKNRASCNDLRCDK